MTRISSVALHTVAALLVPFVAWFVWMGYHAQPWNGGLHGAEVRYTPVQVVGLGLTILALAWWLGRGSRLPVAGSALLITAGVMAAYALDLMTIVTADANLAGVGLFLYPPPIYVGVAVVGLASRAWTVRRSAAHIQHG